MMNLTFETFDAQDVSHQLAVPCIEQWSAAAGCMKPIDSAALEEYPYSILGYGSRQQILGHIAITKIDDGLAEVGALIVNPYERGQGIAAKLLQQLVATAVEQVPEITHAIAYANETSSKLFAKIGSPAIALGTPRSTGCNWVHDLTNAILTSDEK